MSELQQGVCGSILKGLAGGCLALVLAAPLSAQTFVDVTDAAGLGGDFIWGPAPIGVLQMCSAIAVEDYDGDGDDDIFWTAGGGQAAKLFRNEGDGTFVDVAPQAGLDIISSLSMPLWFDKDDDGDLDLFLQNYEMVYVLDFGIAGSGINHPYFYPAGLLGDSNTDFASTDLSQYHNFLFENQGDGTFRDVGFEAGLRRSGFFGATVGDIDGDGLVDLVGASTNTEPNAYMFKNAGNGRFRNVSPPAILNSFGFLYSPGLIDYDNDLDLDFFYTGDFGTSHIWRNDGNWSFTDVTVGIGVGTDENGMGQCWGDVNRDGQPDWFITSIWKATPFDQGQFPFWGHTGNRLYLNDADGTFTDATETSGTRIGYWGWGARVADLDNDGWEDIIHTNGFYVADEGFPEFEDDPVVCFINQGNAVFTEQAASLGLDETHQGRGLVTFDYDNDGDLDVLIANNDTGLSLYRNDFATGNWIRIDLRQQDVNTHAIGAKVTVRVTGEPNQTRWVTANDNFGAQSPTDTFYGVGSATAVNIRVRWADGSISSQNGVPVNQAITITKPLR